MLLPLLRARHSRQAFGHLAETTFLRQKGRLDQVVYSLIRVSDRHLALELYHRLAAGEASFADLAYQFAEGPERQSWGLVGPKPLSQAHPVLAERLRTAQPGVVQLPIPAARPVAGHQAGGIDPGQTQRIHHPADLRPVV